jgi:hypothetical protein
MSSEFVANFTCELCGDPFEPLMGGICSACGKLACLRHLRVGFSKAPTCDDCHKRPTSHGDTHNRP